jgi:DNA repair photolyase
MEEIIINGKCLYSSKGAAREYGPVGCNFYRGCPFQCTYCYNRRGLTAPVLGVDHAVLEDCFTKEKNRPKKYRDISAETYAMIVFKRELERHLDYCRQTGIFFSFSTDPMLDETHPLTWRAVNYAVQKQVPVTVLTKCAFTFELHNDWFGKNLDYHQGLQKYVSFGFTLTGRDDLEEGAARHFSANSDRIKAMSQLKELGYNVWASIEPVIDLDSSFEMICESLPYCDHYKIGLQSGVCKGYYGSLSKLTRFILNVRKAIAEYPDVTVYWKESVRKELAGTHIDEHLNHPQFIGGGFEWVKKKEGI